MSVDTSHPIGFIPRHPAPARYLRVRAHFKKDKAFNRVFLAQELEDAGASRGTAERRASTVTSVRHDKSTGEAVWALAFSEDGKYLAAAGQDKTVRVWAVITTPEERETAIREDENAPLDEQEPPRLKAPVFQSKPVQVFEGHAGSILDLSWSKVCTGKHNLKGHNELTGRQNNFILSSSMDKTVRLWHISRPECLCCFQHSDFVTSIQFHPRDDRFFLAGSLDTKLRLWSIPDKSVAFVTSVPDMITAVAFTPDGRYSMAGCLNGMLDIYDTEGLKVSGQIHVRSNRGRNSKGNKITGIDTTTVPRDDPDGDIKLLVTSNDSRIRLYDFRERTVEAKFRGNENSCSQIRASFTDDGKHVICGSEDRRAYVWSLDSEERDSDKRAVEVFETQSAIVTAAITAPTKTKQILGLSEDPIYDICNPPPVALMNPEESAKPENSSRDNGSHHKRSSSRLSIVNKMAHESPLYLSRSKHPDGNIIVMADYSGKIKVLRQDCAYQKRRYENWDANSTISRRLMRHSNSARQSIASSIGKDSTHKTPSERIISWRNSVIRHGRTSTDDSRSGFRTRSPSPQHRAATFRLSSPASSSLGPNESSSVFANSLPPSPNQARVDTDRASEELKAPNGPGPALTEPADSPKVAASSAELLASGREKDNPLWLQGDQSYAYWNKITHDALAARSRKSNDFLSPHRIPSYERKRSTTGSILSSDYASSNAGEGEEDILRCEHCRGANFRGVRGRDGKQKLICVQCHRSVS